MLKATSSMTNTMAVSKDKQFWDILQPFELQVWKVFISMSWHSSQPDLQRMTDDTDVPSVFQLISKLRFVYIFGITEFTSSHMHLLFSFFDTPTSVFLWRFEQTQNKSYITHYTTPHYVTQQRTEHNAYLNEDDKSSTQKGKWWNDKENNAWWCRRLM